MKVQELIRLLLTQNPEHHVAMNIAGIDAVPIHSFCGAENDESEVHLMGNAAWLVDDRGNRVSPVLCSLSHDEN